MKTSHFILVILLALGAGYAGSQFGASTTASSSSEKIESTYERVMRTGILRCGYGLWPGSTDKDPNTGIMTGWVPAATEALAEKLGLKIEWTAEIAWGQQAAVLASDKVDALCTSDGPWTFTDAKFVDWTTPIIYYPVFMYVRGDESRFTNMADINKPDVTLTAMDGDISAPLHKQFAPQARRLDVPQMGDPSLLVLNVSTGKADAVFLDDQTVQRVRDKAQISLRKFTNDPVIVVPSSFAVRKGETELLQMLNQGIAMLHNMGITRRIIAQEKLGDIVFEPANAWHAADKH